jgi:chromosome segregation ATPase
LAPACYSEQLEKQLAAMQESFEAMKEEKERHEASYRIDLSRAQENHSHDKQMLSEQLASSQLIITELQAELDKLQVQSQSRPQVDEEAMRYLLETRLEEASTKHQEIIHKLSSEMKSLQESFASESSIKQELSDSLDNCRQALTESQARIAELEEALAASSQQPSSSTLSEDQIRLVMEEIYGKSVEVFNDDDETSYSSKEVVKQLRKVLKVVTNDLLQHNR